MSKLVTRREVLKAGGAVGVAAGVTAGGVVGGVTPAAAATPATACPDLQRIGHIIILIQENRSFDSYFGSYKGVRGYNDRTAPGGARAFRQAYSTPAAGIPNPMLPFHLDTSVHIPPRQGECTNDIEHQWAGAHDSWHNGANDNWMGSHIATERDPRQGAVTMGYYTRADLAFYYDLADHFTICDNYFCSVIGGTDQNRLCSITGTVDPDGWDGGATFVNTKTGTIQTPGADMGTKGRWVPYPEVLTKAGISWKVYGTPDAHLGDNVLRYFPQFRPLGGDLSLTLPAFGSNAFPADFAADCATGNLPQVSWLLTSLVQTEHAPAPPQFGESIVHLILTALTTSPVWKDSVLFLTYDENGGFFDHVPPPTPPPGTAGEYFNQAAITTGCRKEMTTVHGVDMSHGPMGLGMRVPLIVISPFARNPTPKAGPLVCSDLNDHTSLLRFIESWSHAIGKPAPIPDRDPSRKQPGLSQWRRATVGDLSTALSLSGTPDASVPTDLLAAVPNPATLAVLTECTLTGTAASEVSSTSPIIQDPVIPTVLSLPIQEPFEGVVQRASRASCPAPAAPATTRSSGGGATAGGQAPSASPARSAPAGRLPATGALPVSATDAMVVGLAAVAAFALRRRVNAPPD